jgi:two-component system, OmpR family, KDP operon response regulator KdpE
MTESHTALRILLVEDEALNRALVRAILTRTREPVLRAAEVIEASTLAEARAALDTRRPDVVLLDMNLPDGSGVEIAAELNARPADERPVVIAVTANVLPQHRSTALDAGCAAFLSKPYVAAELIETLKTHALAALR